MCIAWQKPTKPSRITASKRTKQAVVVKTVRRKIMRQAARFNIALLPSGGFAGI
jgi:hypothetical protein